MDPILVGIISTIVGLWLGGLEIRMRNLDARLRESPSRQEVSKEIEVRLESVKVLQTEIKEDIRLIRETLEKISQK